MLHFTRDRLNAGYQARSDTHAYLVGMHGKSWLLRVIPLTETAGVQHIVGQPIVAESIDDTRSLCYAVANAYHDLGEDYQQHKHGHRSRMTEAVQRAYEVKP